MVDYKVLREVLDLLKPFDYAFFSGMAMEIYTNGKRKANDVDILINKKEIDKFAKLVGCKLLDRVIEKENYLSEDYGGETMFNGQGIELTSGFPKKRMQENTIVKLFQKKVKVNYLGFDVYVVPIEELIMHKAMMQRRKDILDLEMLKSLKYNALLIREFARDFGDEDKAIKFLVDLDYDLSG